MINMENDLKKMFDMIESNTSQSLVVLILYYITR